MCVCGKEMGSVNHEVLIQSDKRGNGWKPSIQLLCEGGVVGMTKQSVLGGRDKNDGSMEGHLGETACDTMLHKFVEACAICYVCVSLLMGEDV